MELKQMQEDIRNITTGSLAGEIKFTTPDNLYSAVCKGFVSKHNMSVDAATGLPVNSRNAHVSVFESVLNDKGYKTRDYKDRVSLKDHMVTFTLFDREMTFLIDNVMPSDTMGVIVCTLGSYIDK